MRACIIDTNLLVLLIVGGASEKFISSHKRTVSYGVEDFHLLTNLLSNAEKIIVTPNILTETSNLVRQFARPGLQVINNNFRIFIEQSCEIYIESCVVARHGLFERLGLTDAAILTMVENGGWLLTDDLDLYVAFQSMGGRAINFSHERERLMRR